MRESARIGDMKKEYPRPLLMVDVVLMSLVQGSLHVGLAPRLSPDEPFHGSWTIPGVQVRTDEDLDLEAAARRALLTKAGLTSPYLEQLYTFGSSVRDSRGWSASVAYYALVSPSVAPADSEVFRWESVDQIRALPFDHTKILQLAVDRVRSKTTYSPLPLYLAPETFLMSELRAIYEQVLGVHQDPRGFERRMEAMGVLEFTGEMRSSGGKPGRVYRRAS